MPVNHEGIISAWLKCSQLGSRGLPNRNPTRCLTVWAEHAVSGCHEFNGHPHEEYAEEDWLRSGSGVADGLGREHLHKFICGTEFGPVPLAGAASRQNHQFNSGKTDLQPACSVVLPRTKWRFETVLRGSTLPKKIVQSTPASDGHEQDSVGYLNGPAVASRPCHVIDPGTR
ncbi:hypothetical protein BX600DRAFT_442236 [Xylariales sp. PMI_506]|nr:hypothetical protein BX600DRAFT_442236 [Xylariales sp. PMI_506]